MHDSASALVEAARAQTNVARVVEIVDAHPEAAEEVGRYARSRALRRSSQAAIIHRWVEATGQQPNIISRHSQSAPLDELLAIVDEFMRNFDIALAQSEAFREATRVVADKVACMLSLAWVVLRATRAVFALAVVCGGCYRHVYDKPERTMRLAEFKGDSRACACYPPQGVAAKPSRSILALKKYCANAWAQPLPFCQQLASGRGGPADMSCAYSLRQPGSYVYEYTNTTAATAVDAAVRCGDAACFAKVAADAHYKAYKPVVYVIFIMTVMMFVYHQAAC